MYIVPQRHGYVPGKAKVCNLGHELLERHKYLLISFLEVQEHFSFVSVQGVVGYL